MCTLEEKKYRWRNTQNKSSMTSVRIQDDKYHIDASSFKNHCYLNTRVHL